MNKTFIPRNTYLASIRPHMDTSLIKVLVGQRRVGKSYFLRQVASEIQKKHPEARIIAINKELYEFDAIANYHDLLLYIKKHTDQIIKSNRQPIFIDEVQEIEGFAKALRDLQAQGKYDIYCTGSNAQMLSSDLSNALGGRYIEIPIHSLSYPEFLQFHALVKSRESLESYIKYGGLPYLINVPLTDEGAYGYARTIFDTILLKDVVGRYNVRNVHLLERLVEYLADSVGSIVSAKRISDFLISQHTETSPNSILNYIHYLTSSFFIHKVKRQQIMGRKVFEINDKYYFEDLGLRHSLIGYKQIDMNKIVENLIYTHLRYLGYTVTIGQLGEEEIDFVAEKQNKKMYIQAAYLLSSKKVIEREFGNLLIIQDNYPKYVISTDEYAGGDHRGIQHIKLIDFLAGDSSC